MNRMLLAGAVLLLSVSAHAGNGLPDSMVGQWCQLDEVYARGSCTDPHTDRELTVKQYSYHGHENDCTFTNARSLARDAYVVNARCEGEAMTWTVKAVFKLVGNERLRVKIISQSGEDD